MQYRVIRKFADSQDNYRVYNVGDIFPHDGTFVSEKRIHELATKENLSGAPVIEPVQEVEPEETEKPKRSRKAKVN